MARKKLSSLIFGCLSAWAFVVMTAGTGTARPWN